LETPLEILSKKDQWEKKQAVYLYKCKLCSNSYKEKKILNRHLKNAHSTDNNYISWQWLDFRLETIFNTAPAAFKNDAQFKTGQNQFENKQLACRFVNLNSWHTKEQFSIEIKSWSIFGLKSIAPTF